MLNGAAVAVRGSAAPAEELAYIIQHASCKGLVVQDANTLKAIAPYLGKVCVCVCLCVCVTCLLYIAAQHRAMLWTTHAESQSKQVTRTPSPCEHRAIA